MYINSALVSAQNRQRFYCFSGGKIEQPEDRGILLKDILESGIVDRERAYCLKHQAGKARDYFKKHHTQIVFEPVRIGTIESKSRTKHDSQQYRVYSPYGKSVSLKANGGGMGAKTGLYACPVRLEKNENVAIYEVKNGTITYKGNQYSINLPDGYYYIRKLTPIECERLQTLPDNYTSGISNTQRYRCLGNGWTAEVIIHILRNTLKDIPRSEKLLVLSMYDGIATGRYCLEQLGFTDIEYHAYEIDKYAKQIELKNYPNIIQRGDAFEIRNTDWRI